jgi:hypothetical protein
VGKREKREGSSGFKREGSLGTLLHERERGKWGSWAGSTQGSRGRLGMTSEARLSAREKKIKGKGKEGRGYR